MFEMDLHSRSRFQLLPDLSRRDRSTRGRSAGLAGLGTRNGFNTLRWHNFKNLAALLAGWMTADRNPKKEIYASWESSNRKNLPPTIGAGRSSLHVQSADVRRSADVGFIGGTGKRAAPALAKTDACPTRGVYQSSG
jgi:hypothetical protein